MKVNYNEVQPLITVLGGTFETRRAFTVRSPRQDGCCVVKLNRRHFKIDDKELNSLRRQHLNLSFTDGQITLIGKPNELELLIQELAERGEVIKVELKPLRSQSQSDERQSQRAQ